MSLFSSNKSDIEYEISLIENDIRTLESNNFNSWDSDCQDIKDKLVDELTKLRSEL